MQKSDGRMWMVWFRSLLIFVLICSLSSGFLALGVNDDYETDRLALLEIKAKLADPNRVLSTWNDTIPLCEWHGVVCGLKHKRVTVLDLRSQGLSGVLSPHIGNLSFVRRLQLENNSFHSAIPSEIGNLRRLRGLYLSNNSFSGVIPSNLSRCSNLVAVYIGRNWLEGNLPKEIGFLSKLQGLGVPINNLSGHVSPSVGNLSSLQYFIISSNMFDGAIPRSVFNITSLKVLEVSENQLEGTLPSDIGKTLPNIERIGMSDNKLSGSIPMSLSNATSLTQMEIILNNFTGDVPSFARATGLQWFSVGRNQLGSRRSDDLSFLCSLTSSTSLEILGIDGNDFSGSIPECVGNLSKTMQLLSFGENNISGTLPASIGNLTNLEVLRTWGNNIQGSIPSSIGNLMNLNELTLYENEHSGQIPPSLGNLEVLTELYLFSNKLHGPIPSTLGNCKNLLVVALFGNNLNGQIPPEILGLSSLSILLDLSENNLTGPLPIEVGKLRNLGELRLHRNQLLGSIPGSIGSCQKMERLYLQENFFEGPIPESLGSLKGLQVLNLSNNRLSGLIPPALQFLNLTNLSLSYNDFEGALPTKGVFGSVFSVSVAGNTKLCGGLSELHLPECRATNFRKPRLSRKAKILICTLSGLFSVVGMLTVVYLFWRGRKGKSPDSNSSEAGQLKVSYYMLSRATDGFSSENLIGVGSFGSMYRGILDQIQTTVAVKVLDLTRYGASKSFVAECEALRNIRHRNLVKVLSACSGFDLRGEDFKALVYEYLSNSNLDEWLHSTNKERRKLSLVERVNIAIDVACALDYLHNHCVPPIVHCDLKPSNVLLDDDMTGHVGDFGLARFLPDATHELLSSQTSSVGLKGSSGYIAPGNSKCKNLRYLCRELID